MFLAQVIIVLILIFGGLVYALRQVLTKNISHATSHLDELSAEFIRREEEVRRKQEEADRYHKETMDKAQGDADRLRQQMAEQVELEKEKMLAAARAQSEEIVAKAERTRGVITDDLRRTVEARMSERLGECFVEILPEHARRALHDVWVADLLSGALGDVAAMRIPADAAAVRAVSAYPLSEAQKQALEKKLREAFRRDFSFQEETDPALVGGVLLEIGSLVLDGSVRNRIHQVVHEAIR
ncbi:MAG: F0F1 ATP synthase subunit delta [Deltaproteobacteria bacterium]